MTRPRARRFAPALIATLLAAGLTGCGRDDGKKPATQVAAG